MHASGVKHHLLWTTVDWHLNQRQIPVGDLFFTIFLFLTSFRYAVPQLPPRNYTAVRRRARDDDIVIRGGIGARVEILAFNHHETICS